jgi:glycerate 2-kinase
MTTRSAAQLREDALAIWQAGVNAVRADALVEDNVQVIDDLLLVAGHEFALTEIDRIVIVGAGKAGAGMARGLETALGDAILSQKKVQGWVNVPADCVSSLKTITLHPARPAGQNEPTAAGVVGTETILNMVAALTPRDLCIALISGGGSALLPAPADGISLAEKQQLTRFLSGAGANIQALNTVRKQLSRIKGGGLARACRAGNLVSLILSDVLGDPLESIASGPTVRDSSTPQAALQILEQYDPQRTSISANVYRFLEQKISAPLPPPPTCRVVNEVIGNLAVAVDAAGVEAERRGYSHAMLIAREPEGAAEAIGRHLAQQALLMRATAGPDCLITGGEPVVTLAPAAERGRGGRNQQLVLAAAQTWQQSKSSSTGMVLLSGGTDGEDGPTDAAGAWLDAQTLIHAEQTGLSLNDYLRRNDAYTFFEQVGGLMKTGPTHTNVCDIRVIVVDRIAHPPRLSAVLSEPKHS